MRTVTHGNAPSDTIVSTSQSKTGYRRILMTLLAVIPPTVLCYIAEVSCCTFLFHWLDHFGFLVHLVCACLDILILKFHIFCSQEVQILLFFYLKKWYVESMYLKINLLFPCLFLNTDELISLRLLPACRSVSG